MTATLTEHRNGSRHSDPDCRHGLTESTCSICKHSSGVYISEGGRRYHWYRDCESLHEGQDKVLRRGGVPSAIRRVTESAALADGRNVCRTCRRRRSRRST